MYKPPSIYSDAAGVDAGSNVELESGAHKAEKFLMCPVTFLWRPIQYARATDGRTDISCSCI